jgi:citrate lyase subunit beta/citryl-CoA lyase
MTTNNTTQHEPPPGGRTSVGDTPDTPRVRNERAAKLPANLSRSWLLVNATKPDQFEPALLSEADSVIFDLEAAVPDDRKEEARFHVVNALNTGLSAWVRINAMDTEHWKTDLEALIQTPGLRGVMLAQTEKPEQVTLTAMRLHAGTPVIALIESALGVENATAIASAPGTFRLAFGVNDFRKDTGATEDPMALAYARGKLVVASRVGKLPGPIDGPPAATDSVDAVLAACGVTQRMGMTGKMCLTIDQVDDVNRGLSPSEEELEWARELITQHEQAQRGRGVDIADGSYLPRLARAQKVANLADTYGLWKN